ncbi:hypothetical protein [Gulosibacter sp. 10]|uniref:hypothetical protein n=1 Tax=Gulosibacter sp. 10 TaxID=1255570 RepID=UPI00097ED0DA|nr:hypothetical protein [Gulosibacter sp. 10]SJM69984.1 hypothetical protein FM112_14585 [Gulosibacter sp. 10]
MASLFFAVIMGGLAALVMPLALKSSKQRERYAARKAKFEAGEGKNPDKDVIGPHQPFVINALVMGGIFAAVGAGVGMAAPPGLF